MPAASSREEASEYKYYTEVSFRSGSVWYLLGPKAVEDEYGFTFRTHSRYGEKAYFLLVKCREALEWVSEEELVEGGHECRWVSEVVLPRGSVEAVVTGVRFDDAGAE